MAPLHAEGPDWRLLLGAAIPLLLSALVAPEGNTAADLHTALRPAPQVAPRSAARHVLQTSRSWPAFPVPDESGNLRAYVERARPYLDDPPTMYYVAQALEECYSWG